jgi:vancomycin permeability regulator SanA
MGFRKPINYNEIQRQLTSAGVEVSSPFNDGYTSFYVKQDLYRVKWLVDSILEQSPSFAGEEEFIEEHKKDVFWRKLKA